MSEVMQEALQQRANLVHQIMQLDARIAEILVEEHDSGRWKTRSEIKQED